MSFHAFGFALLVAGFWIGAGALAMALASLASAVFYCRRDRPVCDDDPRFVLRTVSAGVTGMGPTAPVRHF